jgi:drug/metabolite transporter (DMT)-like permease
MPESSVDCHNPGGRAIITGRRQDGKSASLLQNPILPARGCFVIMLHKRASPRLTAVLLAVFVTVLWSSSWVLIKIGLRGNLPPLTFAGMRYSLAFLVLIPFVLFNPSQQKVLKRLTRRDLGKLFLLGVVFYTITQGAMFMALESLPANTLSLLLNLTSVFVGIAGIFLLKEYPSLLQWAGICLAVVGVFIYFFPISLPREAFVGVGIGLFCMAANVISALFSREVNRNAVFPPLVVTFISMGIGSVLLLVTGLILQGPGAPTGQDWLIIAWLAVFNTALAFTLWNRSLQELTAVESSILNSLMMPQIAFLAFVFLGEGLTARDIFGLVLVGIGTLIVQLKSPKSM